MNYNELLKEKITCRATDPLRSNILSVITSNAAAIAKAANREVTEDDLLTAIRKEAKDTEKIIELTKSKGGDITNLERELAIYKAFLPKTLNEEETEKVIDDILVVLLDEKIKKNMGLIIKGIKYNHENFGGPEPLDYGLVSKILQRKLK